MRRPTPLPKQPFPGNKDEALKQLLALGNLVKADTQRDWSQGEKLRTLVEAADDLKATLAEIERLRGELPGGFGMQWPDGQEGARKHYEGALSRIERSIKGERATDQRRTMPEQTIAEHVAKLVRGAGNEADGLRKELVRLERQLLDLQKLGV